MHLRWQLSVYCCLLVLNLMSHICTGCSVGYPSSKGLERHENQCLFKIAQQTVPDNALEIYQKKKERKRQEALKLRRRELMADDPPMSELPHVRQFLYFRFPVMTVLYSFFSPLVTMKAWMSTRSSFKLCL